ncbi:MAG: LysM peptidoglycan-binding domain-containing M23 family metallopeptidase [Alphaproteobacteria bacterium]|nr:LysM peptidoglycan-binding domain-containing M23 family metallopeptidase [Alphaproteobacteria bacterium]MBV9965534.1 LysM peptidoglycan-binding domain-containing M23 family metallopeptidase [Alphaproteobacteria bacterium]
MQVGKLAVQYHVSKQSIIAANHLEPPGYKVKIGSKLTIPGAAAPATQTAMASASSASNPDVIPLDERPAPRVGPPSSAKPAAPPAAVASLPPPISPPPLSPPPARPTPPPIAAAAPPSPPSPAPAPPQSQSTAWSPGPTKSIAFPPPRESSAAEEARAEAASPPGIQSTGSRFPWPVRGRVLGVYGVAADGTHNDGINIAASRGTPIKSVESGIVAYVGNELRGYGNLILVKHTNGWISAYAHCDEVLVRKGDPVYRGQTIAKVGATGGVDEPQLHFELRQGKRPVDPRGFLEPAPSA